MFCYTSLAYLPLNYKYFCQYKCMYFNHTFDSPSLVNPVSLTSIRLTSRLVFMWCSCGCYCDIANKLLINDISLTADRVFIEQRRRSLRRFLNLTVRHPVFCDDKIVIFFLTFNGSVRSVVSISYIFYSNIVFYYNMFCHFIFHHF